MNNTGTGGTYIKQAYISNICYNSVFLRAGIYSDSACMEVACIRDTSVRDIYISNANVIKHSKINSQFFQIWEVGLFDT